MTASPETFPDIAAASLPQRIAAGARFAVGGVPFVLQHGQLLRLAIIPVILNIILFGIFVVGGITRVDDVVQAAALGIDEQAWYHFVETIWQSVVWLATLVGVLLGGFLLTVVVGNVLAGPIYDLISERTEILVLGRSAAEPFSVASFMRDLAGELFLTVVRLVLYLSGLVCIFLLGLVPVIGQVAGPVLSATWSWLFLTLELKNASLARHGVGAFGRFGHVFGKPTTHLGFGAASWLMMWVPVMMPFLVAGATRHYLALAAWDRVPSRLSDDDKGMLRAA